MRWHRQLVLCCFHMLIRALHGYEMYKLYNFEYNVTSRKRFYIHTYSSLFFISHFNSFLLFFQTKSQ